MNIENMEQEFPKMPQSMRDMIEKEVEKQVKVTPQRGCLLYTSDAADD